MKKDSKEYILQHDWISEKLEGLGQTNWVTVYAVGGYKHHTENLNFFSAFIPSNRKQKVLQNFGWDILTGYEHPDIRIYNENGVEKVEYFPINQPDSIFPLVIARNFYGLRPDYLEILEEFRLFHNLYHDTRNNVFIKFTESGDEEEIIRIRPKHVDIRLKALKQFLAFRGMYLAIYFVIRRYSTLQLDDIEESERTASHVDSNMCYTRNVGDYDHEVIFSRLLGKKLIEGMPLEETGFYPFEKQQKYEDYIIGIDENGNEYSFSSNPDNLANFFGQNPNNPFYLTPVFFKRDVLKKYYEDTDKYEVLDGYIKCGGYWGIEIDNNHTEYVIVYLGDLGKLPFNEQRYWRSYNVARDGGISDVAYKRGIEAEFADPTEPALLFKYRFEQFQKKWLDKFDWYLFKPLNENDEYHLKALRMPLNTTQSEFDEQVLSLTKVLIDSLNEKNLKQAITSKLDSDTRGISKLELYLQQEKVADYQDIIDFMRILQSIRSWSSAHRKSSDFDKKMEKLNIDLNNLPDEFKHLLEKAIEVLQILENHFFKIEDNT